LREKYNLSGYIILEVYTTEGAFSQQFDLALEVEEVPF